MGTIFGSRKDNLYSASAILCFLAIWEILGRSGRIDPILLSYPSQIAEKYWQVFFITKEIYPHLLVSTEEALLGFGFSVVIGIIFGLLMGKYEKIHRVLEPFVMAAYSTPNVALLPLFILWLGIGLWSKVLLIFLGGVFAVLVNTEAGVRNTNPRLIETARSFKANERQIFLQIMLPSAVPYILAGIRLAIGRILISVFVAEMYASTKGVGFIITQAGATYDTSLLFAGVFLLTGTGIVLSRLVGIFEKRKLAYLREE